MARRKARGQGAQDWGEGEEGEGEGYIRGEHDAQGNEEGHEFPEEGAEAAEQLVERLHIIGHPGGDSPHGNLVPKGCGLAEQL